MAEYDITAKEVEFADTFVDEGPPYDPAVGPSDVFFRRVVENVAEFVVAFQHDGTITYVNDSIRPLLGYEPADILGSNALLLIHPDDMSMAADTIYHAARVEGWRPPRPFRLLHADGGSATFEVEGLSLFHVPEVRSIVAVCRWAEETARVDRTIALLVAHAPLAEVLGELVHAMWRPGWRLGVAVQYDDDAGGLAVAHTGLPPQLAPPERDDPDTPWARAVRSLEPVHDVGLASLDPDLRAAAETLDYHAVWAIPVPDPGRRPACILVWNHELVVPELGQETLLTKLVDLIRFALEGRSRATELERAATTDVLTGLANRRGFEDALAEAGNGAIAVVYLDLDGFKAVNDDHGHAAGDTVIREVGTRIDATVRHGDLAARVGGDEFAILCREVSDAEVVEALAARLIDALALPLVLPSGSEARIGASAGIAVSHSAGTDPAHLLEAADRALYEAKQAGKGTYRTAAPTTRSTPPPPARTDTRR